VSKWYVDLMILASITETQLLEEKRNVRNADELTKYNMKACNTLMLEVRRKDTFLNDS
jgi:hypothetical protein